MPKRLTPWEEKCMVFPQMDRIPSLFLIITMSLLMGGCASRHTSQEYTALQSELDTCKKQNETCQSDKKRQDKDLDETRKNLEKASADITSSSSSKHELLDKNINCLEENKTLLKQISRIKVLLQEKKDTQWRLDKSYNYLTSYFEAERMNDQLYIVKGDDAVRIIIPQKVIFSSPFSAWLLPKGMPIIKKVAKGLDECKPLSVEVAGYTDDTAIPKQALKTYPTQWDLSYARAVAVLLALENLGIKKEKLSAVSYGDTRPIADSTSDDGRAMNRRVEIVITP
jgi:flagellar motor protein MotB